MGEIVVVVDTSGSIDDPTLQAFGAEITAIRDSARPAKTHVIYCDSRIAHVDQFEPNDEFKIARHGGGGTDFRPPFDYAAEKHHTRLPGLPHGPIRPDARGPAPLPGDVVLHHRPSRGPGRDAADRGVRWTKNAKTKSSTRWPRPVST